MNPYRWDLVDPSIFYGRAETVRYLLDRLLAGDRFAVAGGRRMGKTTLLRRLEAELTEVGSDGGLLVVPVFVDVAELYGGSAEEAYGLLARKREGAVALFEWVTRRFPASANAWDSLSEAYEGGGRSADAAKAVERALAVLPGDKAVVGARRAALEKALRERKARVGR